MFKPLKFETVKQPKGSKLCGAAVCAMAVNWALKETVTMMGPEHPHGGYCLGVMNLFLARHGVLLAPVQLNRADLDRFTCLLGVSSENFPGKGHWVFWDDHARVIRDPVSVAECAMPDLYWDKVDEMMVLHYLPDFPLREIVS